MNEEYQIAVQKVVIELEKRRDKSFITLKKRRQIQSKINRIKNEHGELFRESEGVYYDFQGYV